MYKRQDLEKAAEEWVRECDHDWSAVLGGATWAAMASVRFTCAEVFADASVIDLAEWFWHPVNDARSTGVRA